MIPVDFTSQIVPEMIEYTITLLIERRGMIALMPRAMDKSARGEAGAGERLYITVR